MLPTIKTPPKDTANGYEPLSKDFLIIDPQLSHMSWSSMDYELWYRQDVHLYGDGRIVLVGDPIVGPYPNSLKNVKVTDEKGKEIIENAKPRKRGKCNGCGSKKPIANVVRWFGIRWYGIPMPVRYMRRWFAKDAPTMDSYEGCGCIIKLKVVWLVLGRLGHLSWEGSKQVWAA